MSTGRSIHALRQQIESATGLAFAPPWRSGAAPVVWGRNRLAGLASGLGRAPLIVEPGPLLTPYDTPATGLASLRLSSTMPDLMGSTGAKPIDPGALRDAKVFGRNRFGRDEAKAIAETLAGLTRPSLILVEGDLADAPRRLRTFVRRAIARFPGESLVVAGSEGCPALPRLEAPRLRVIARPINPWALFAHMRRVLVEDWRSACEARIAGVEIFRLGPLDEGGARDGLGTGEASPVPTLDDLVTLRYGTGVHYFDPWTREPIAFEACLERVTWLRDRFADNDRPTVLVGISRWKRPALDVFMRGPHGDPVHAMTAEDAVAAARRHRARVVAWATRMPERLDVLCREEGVPLARMEDGFLRSVGLGASLQPGASIVVDDRGIYYDPRTESRLTHILRTARFTPELTARARALREEVVARRLTKYNVGLAEDAGTWPTDRRIVLVPGQVEDDASVMYGSPIVRSNLDLLRAARLRNPDAFLLYKPHPDVEAGFRPGAIPEAEALGLADRIVGGLSIVDLLDRAQHVETMTSLAGFEALIRGLTVTTHGRPFYAGWGLSEDLAPNADKGRHLALDELVAGALLLYPLYLDPVAMKPCTPEQLLERLAAARDAAAPSRLAMSRGALLLMRARYAALNPIVRRLRRRRGVTKADEPRR